MLSGLHTFDFTNQPSVWIPEMSVYENHQKLEPGVYIFVLQTDNGYISYAEELLFYGWQILSHPGNGNNVTFMLVILYLRHYFHIKPLYSYK